MTEATRLQFGTFELNTARYELLREGSRIRLERIPMDLLLLLLEHRGEVVSREQIVARLWGKDVFVDAGNKINAAIRKIRQALRDAPEAAAFVQTIVGKGYRFIATVTYPDSDSETAIQPQLIRSIAVLPFENRSGDPSHEYFSDGMTDELTSEIARISSLRVISRTSTMRYKGTARKPLPEIARELNVDAVVEGTVAQEGQRVRINVQLIAAKEDRHLWSERYERDLMNIFTLQSEVARAVTGQIQIKLAPGESSSLARTRHTDPRASEAYLKGIFFLHKLLPGISRSIEFFSESLKVDPAYADTHARLAEALCYAGIFGLRPSNETHSEARMHALKALELDPSNAAAHNVLADIKKGLDWDLAGAELEYRRSIALNPSHFLRRLWFGECLARMGRFDEALLQSDHAVQLDPVSPLSYNNRGMLFFRARRYDEAIIASQQALDLEPSFVNALWWQGLSYAGKRDFANAIACLTKLTEMNDGPIFRASLAYVYGLAGDRAKAKFLLNEMTTFAMRRHISPVDFAIVHAGLNNADLAFEWLEKAYAARATRVHELTSLYFDNLSSDPRYVDLRIRVGLS